MLKYVRYWIWLIAVWCSIPAQAETTDVDSLSFEDLGKIVTSVSKRPEDTFRSAAPVTVITQDDIRQSGATHIAELFRMVPGLDVAQSNYANWAVSSRGFNDVFANKLLVLVDGRTVYNPLFSGVYWDVQDMVLEDIERIEVIRGPGAALWGANAVNGVINIITKSAEKTQGAYASQLIGTQDRSITEARFGGLIGDDQYYRTYVKYSDRMASETLDHNNAGNHWNLEKTGFRVDRILDPTQSVTVQGDVYSESVGLDIYEPSAITPPATYLRDRLNSTGLNVLGRWTQKTGADTEQALQVYFDNQSPSYSLLHQDLNTVDIDYQRSINYGSRHQLVFGSGYRLVADQFDGSNALSVSPESSVSSLYNGFLQDTISLVPRTVDLTLGSKVEHNDYTGFEVEPSARLAWYPTTNQTVWASSSRSVRTPSRAERDGQLNLAYDPSIGAVIREEGNNAFKSEVLNAYEMGYRIKLRPDVTVDAATFVNNYNALRTFEIGKPEASSVGPILPVVAKNLGGGQTFGVELATTWDITRRWWLKGAYTFTEIQVRGRAGSTDISLSSEDDKVPQNQASLRSNVQVINNIDWMSSIYYVQGLKAFGVNSYCRFDSGLSWRVDNGITVSLMGQNLFDGTHQEFGSSVESLPSLVERSVYAKITVGY